MTTNVQFMQGPKCVPTVRHKHTHTHTHIYSSCKVNMQYPGIPASKQMMYFYGKADKETPLLRNLVHHKPKIKLPQFLTKMDCALHTYLHVRIKNYYS